MGIGISSTGGGYTKKAADARFAAKDSVTPLTTYLGTAGLNPVEIYESVVVSGAGTTSSNGTYIRTGFSGGKPVYNSGLNTLSWSIGDAQWYIFDDEFVGDVTYVSNSDTSYPWEATGWSAVNAANPAPTLTPGSLTIAVNILPTVTNYLSTNNVLISTLKVIDDLTVVGNISATGTTILSTVNINGAFNFGEGDPALVVTQDGVVLINTLSAITISATQIVGFDTYDQSLNTTDSVTFAEVTVGDTVIGGSGIGAVTFGRAIDFEDGSVTGDYSFEQPINFTYTTAATGTRANLGLNTTDAVKFYSLTATEAVYAQGGNSNQWNSAHTTVQSNSASWEESAEILPTVTNYLSTNNVLLSSATVSNTLAIDSVQIRTRPTSNVFIGNSTTGRDAATGNHNFVFGLSAGNALTTGDYNVFVGACAGRINTTGAFNNFLGYSAGRSNTTGAFNNFLGFSAGLYNTTGANNNFFGNNAGGFSRLGGGNNFFGVNAGLYNDNSCNNNFFGNNAGLGIYDPYLYRGCSSNKNNNFFGTNAGYSIDSGSNNNFFGTNAGRTNATGWNNIAIGTCADISTNSLSGVIAIGTGAIATQTNQIVLSTADISLRTLKGSAAGPNLFIGDSTTGRDAATGDHNFVFGFCAGNALTSSCSNNFLGCNAGRNVTTGGYNNFFGANAGSNNNTGRNNNFFGNNAGRDNTSGTYNNFLGSGAGLNNTTGCNNNFLGLCAGGYNTAGSDNSFLGRCAGVSNTTGTFNNFIGGYSGRCNSTGSFNNFFGADAGQRNSSGCNNNFLGTNAGCAVTTGCHNNIFGTLAAAGFFGFITNTGNSNNFIGYHTGRNVTSGSCNIFLGHCTGGGVSTGVNNVMIGTCARPGGPFPSSVSGAIAIGTNAIATESNQIVLSSQNVVFRSLSDTFNIGASNQPNNLTVFGNLSVLGTMLSGNTDLITIINNLMPKYASVSATNVSEGNYSLSGFPTNKFLIKWINIQTTSTDYDLSLYSKNDYTSNKFDVVFNQNGNNSFYIDYPFEDLDQTQSLFMNFTSYSGSETYTIEVKAVTLQ